MRPGGDAGGTTTSRRPRRRAGRVQPRLPLPQGDRPEAPAGGSRPAADAAGQAARRQLRRGVMGRGAEGGGRAPIPHPGRWRPQRGGRVPRAIPVPTTSPRCCTARCCSARSARERLSRQLGGPDAQAHLRRADVRRAALDPDPRRGPHRPPAVLGANPLVSNGSLLTAPDMRGRLRELRERGGKSWWSTPAAPARPRPPTSTTSSAPAGRPSAARHRAHAVRRGSGRHPALCEHLSGARGRGEPGARLRAGGGVGRMRDRGRARSAAWRASWRGRARRRVRADRHLHAGVRHAGQLAGGRAQRAHRQPRSRGRRDVHHAPRRASATRPASPAAGGASRSGAGTAGCAGWRKRSASCRCPASRRRSTLPARARCARWSPRPATRCVSTPNSERLERAVRGSNSCSRSTST